MFPSASGTRRKSAHYQEAEAQAAGSGAAELGFTLLVALYPGGFQYWSYLGRAQEYLN